MSRCSKFLLAIVLLALPVLGFSQQDRKEELQKEKIRLQDEIELANKILEETRASKKSSLGSIETVEQKLRLRQNLIRTLDREIDLITEDIDGLQTEIDTLEAQVKRLKADYARMIRHAWRSSNKFSRLLFILSSEDFNQAIRRLEYLKQYSEFRRRQVEDIERKENELTEKIAELRRQKVRKEALKGEMQKEKQTLLAEKEQQEKSIANLQARESEITKELQDKQAKAKQLDNEIQRIIAAEIRRAKEKAIRNNLETEATRMGLVAGKDYSSRTSNKALEKMIDDAKAALRAANKPVEEKTTTAEAYSLTPEATKLAANFAANKSRLPWPVERGLVISSFGANRHAVAKSVVLNNKGIDIATEKGSKARAAFDGEVVDAVRVPGEGFAVIVSHGNYFTVYNYLTEVYVKGGDKISAKQELGLVRTNDEQGKTVLHFELWQESQPLNPEPWLAQK